jgi:hypothetical protein
MQQEANNFLMSLSRILFFHKSTVVSMSKALPMSTQTDGKEGVKKTSHMSNNTHPSSSSSSIGCVISFPKAQALS